MLFSLFDLVGLQFSPRIRDMADQRLYRIDRSVRYQHIEPLFSGALNQDLILRRWDDLPSRHLFGQPAGAYGYTDKVTLLRCPCGEPGCWPLLARVTITAETVVWSEFEQPHRHGRWSYEMLGPFVFDRWQYERTIETSRQAI